MGDACSLVDAFRAKELSPLEALDASLAAIEASKTNAFSFLDPDAARAAAASVDVSLPFGGVPMGIKELHKVKGWPETHGSLAFKDQVASVDGTEVARLRRAGAVLAGLTTSSEFGFVGYTSTKLNGTTRNPWALASTPGGSSGGSAAAVAGGLVPLCEAMDGGGSIRIPAGYSGLVGLKPTFGRIPTGPATPIGAMIDVYGCVARSVRDTARYLDVCNGVDGRDRFSLPRTEGWEAGLGTGGVRGLRVAISPDLWGLAVVHPDVAAIVQDAAEALVAAAGLRRVDARVAIPPPGLDTWAAASSGLARYVFEDVWPECADDLTDELRLGLMLAEQAYDVRAAARIQGYRVQITEAVADMFDQADVVLCATNPVDAYPAEGPTPMMVGDVPVDPFNAGKLTAPANMTGCPAISIPAGVNAAGVPVGLQVYAPRYREAVLLDLALIAERERPWPLTAPGAPT
jgi:aspartyl-tRNA(Asn)/glutamyl-tRNA(Gln) amidotransferase subunit A